MSGGTDEEDNEQQLTDTSPLLFNKKTCAVGVGQHRFPNIYFCRVQIDDLPNRGIPI